MAKRKSAKAEREKLVKEVSRTNDRAAIAKKKKALGDAKAGKRSAIKEARTACKLDRDRTNKKTRAAYKRTIGRARAKRDEQRAAARSRCEAGIRTVEETYNPRIKKSAEELAEERQHQNEIRRVDAANKDRQRSRAKSWERMQESNEEVEQNLPPELRPVWHLVKGTIKAGGRRSRLEAFLERVEEDPDLVPLVQERLERERLKQLEREEAAHFEQRRPRKPKAKAKQDEDLGDVVAGAFDEVASFFDELAGGEGNQAAA
ncbi:hypothetical protein [Polyangium jinanense]|uniref:Uncharacterized protein n=1 Tax=Polyangium jinanense TaxID=2829994 RepID=A0A9X4AYE8_9BACT|nr:hypothetical protein [Polyangium jinanense]MDC3988716.1 hypothetical protein [Polyangium jinanense]